MNGRRARIHEVLAYQSKTSFTVKKLTLLLALAALFILGSYLVKWWKSKK